MLITIAEPIVMKREVISQLCWRVSLGAVDQLQAWRTNVCSLVHRPGAVLWNFLILMFALWLSFQQVSTF
ncbi:hypothetical protein BsWGS_04048 [Bradybaena similaris]